MPGPERIRWHAVAADRLPELVARGHRQRSCFPHRAAFLPRPGSEGFKLAERMCGVSDPAALWEVVLFATGPVLDEFPQELFFDDDVMWHRRHLGRTGHVAYADVVLSGREMWSMSHVSDLVQRIGRRREHKTRIENRFGGWVDMLLNALLGFATDRGMRTLRVPTADLQIRHTDPARTVQPELFERVYDRTVQRLLRVSRDGDWWLADVEANRDRLVVPTVVEEELPRRRVVCLCHDVEAGLGHVGIDDPFAVEADRAWRESLARMLSAERSQGVHATYSVVGKLLQEARPEIEADGHCLAFHSYDHTIDSNGRRRRLLGRRRASEDGRGLHQLPACRDVDYRLKGYRIPQSRPTRELTDENLLFHNFEWLASSSSATGIPTPALRAGIVRMPVHLDDFGLYTREANFDDWRRRLRETAAAHEVAVVSLHDCYASLWLDRYAELLADLQSLGELRTLDAVAADVVLAAAA